jgi:hypothetical protein
MRCRAARGLVLLALLVGPATPALATVVRLVPLARLAVEAAQIVHGTVVDVRSGRDGSGLPATWVTLEVARTLKGRRTARLTLKQYGTAEPLSDGTASRIPGLPAYGVGDEVVLFLRAESRRGFTSPVGLGQGAYRVSRAGPRPRVRAAAGGSQDLEEFLSEVTRLGGLAP